MKMYINGKRTETVGVSEGLDVGEEDGEEVGCKQAAFGYVRCIDMNILHEYMMTYISTTH